jgi:hypothetical protein
VATLEYSFVEHSQGILGINVFHLKDNIVEGVIWNHVVKSQFHGAIRVIRKVKQN